MAEWGIGLLIIVLAVIWALVTVCKSAFEESEVDEEYDISESEPATAWNRPDVSPPAPGLYRSRASGKPKTESLSTCWTGQKWVYQGGFECYVQEREWREMHVQSDHGIA